MFEQEFREDLGWWYRNDPQKAFKVLDIVQDVLRDPLKGIGKPEPLKHLDPDTWSRRIDLEHRVVYRVTQVFFSSFGNPQSIAITHAGASCS